MSVIFDAMLVFGLVDREAVGALNKALYAKDVERRQQFNKVDMDGAGGSRFFTTDVYAAAFNHFIPSDVEDCICAAPWRRPDWVLYIRDLGDYHYGEDATIASCTVAELRAGKWTEEAA